MKGMNRIRSKVGWMAAGLTLVTVGALVAGRPPVVVPGSTWDTVGEGKSTVQGQGSIKGPAWVEVYFGAQAGLAADEFLAVIDDGSTEFYVVGNYYEKKPGKIAPLEMDWSDLQDELDQLMGGMFSIDILKSKAKAKAKNTAKYGELLKFKFKVKFAIDGFGEHLKIGMKCKTVGGRM